MEKITRSIYVDDIISGADTDDHAYGRYSDSKMMFKEGRFNQRKFVTNSSDLQKKIVENKCLMQLPLTDHTLNDEEWYAKLTLGPTQKVPTGEIKILGVRWNPSTDRFVFDFRDVVSRVQSGTH